MRSVFSICVLLGMYGCLGAGSRYVFPSSRGYGVTEASSAWPDASAVLLEDVATLSYGWRAFEGVQGKRLAAVLEHRRQYHIVSERGLSLAEVSLPIDGYSSVVSLAIRVYDPQAHRWSHVHTRVVEQVEVKNPRIGRVKVSVPGVKVGGLLEYRYERVYTDVDMVPLWVVGGEHPVVRSEFRVVAEKGVDVQVQQGQGAHLSSETPFVHVGASGLKEHVCAMRDIPPLYAEDHMPYQARVASWVLSTVRAVARQDGTAEPRMQTWEDVGRKITDLGRRFQPTTDPALSVEELYLRIRDRLSVLPYTGLGVAPPPAAADLEKGVSVTSRDAALYMAAAMDAHKPSVVLVSTFDAPFVVDSHPGVYPFATALVRVNSYGREVYFDPSCTYCEPGEVSPALRGAQAMVVGQDGHTEWATIPVDDNDYHGLHIQWTGTMNTEGVVQGLCAGTASGFLGRQWQHAFDTTDPKEVLRAQLWGTASSSMVSPQVSVRVRPAEKNVGFEVDTSLKLSWDGFSKGFGISPADWVGASFPEMYRSVRAYPFVFEGGPYVRSFQASLLLPEGVSVGALPEKVVFQSPFLDYQASFSQQGRHVRYSRTLTMKIHTVMPSEWSGFYDAVLQIKEAESTPLLLHFVR